MSKKSANVISDLVTSSLVVKPIRVQEKPKTNTFQCSSSENRLKIPSKGFKEKIVNKVRSWSSRDKYFLNEPVQVETRLPDSSKHEEIETESMENLPNSNLTRARDSLESLHERNVPGEDWRPRSCSSAPKSLSKNAPDSPKSSPDTSKTAKTLFWDPFDKRGRKNRKDFNRKKKKNNNTELPKQETSSIPIEGKSCLMKPCEKQESNVEDCETVEEECSYKYKYFPKNSKSVVFTNEVFVVYYHENDVVLESKEPLKKDVDQQERNKEMRQGHLLKTQEKYNLCLY